ncbi:MAG TPA: glycosyltransferase [Anaerolineaceae bacterium]|nr:glycosyltransferase [Anaerolineaceae bacterium]NMC17364.1 glycosyltransferase family 4 protein [Chloroflexota bacterium]HNS07886.1 glycosyltransferase [Anaerolineaceae bacterium]HNW13710.1 glycosyltransferase [Anaerolineaceae bacterium]HOE02805.1 glycosyltransferase [Anaerolineaceae bacterium]
MNLLIIADGRSPITRRWIRMLQPLNYTINLVSTYPCQPVDGVNETILFPVAFAGLSGSQAGGGARGGRKVVSRYRGLAATLRHWLGPLTITHAEKDYLELLNRLQPDLVHALRIPYEGMLASRTPTGIPLVISTWGNDFTYHAISNGVMGSATRRALLRADGLISDTVRDLRIARAWSFNPAKPAVSVPGNGGIDLAEIENITQGIDPAVPWQVINPRGFRSGSVRNDTFFKSIPLILSLYPEVQFICPWMAGQPEALSWVNRLRILDNVSLLPMISQAELWREFARSLVSVSVSEHDGTPNSLLEAIAIGCLPVCGDIESIREWIRNGENGILVDPADAYALAEAVQRGIMDEEFRRAAAARNREIIRERAEITIVRQKVAEFYQRMTGFV